MPVWAASSDIARNGFFFYRLADFGKSPQAIIGNEASQHDVRFNGPVRKKS